MVGINVILANDLRAFGEQDRGFCFATVHVIVVVRLQAGGSTSLGPIAGLWEQLDRPSADIGFLDDVAEPPTAPPGVRN